MADRQRHEHSPQGRLLGLLEVGDQPGSVGGDHLAHDPGLTLLLGRRPGVQRRRSHLRLGQSEQVALVGKHLGL